MNNPAVKSLFHAPMAEICRNWQLSRQVGLRWFFEMARSLQAPKIRFEDVKIASDLYEALIESCQNQDLKAEFLISSSALNDWSTMSREIERGVKFCVLLHKSLSPDFLMALEKLKGHRDGLNFVMIVRKDWDFKNTFRSLPSYVRESLSLDFPVSLHSRDPFYQPEEARKICGKLNQNFPMNPVLGFSCHGRMTSLGLETNISHFSKPRKLSASRPRISLVVTDPERLKEITASPWFEKSSEQFEILVARVAGEKTRVVPKLKSILTTRIWAHPVEEKAAVNRSCMMNYILTQADGEILFILDDNGVRDFDAIISLLLAEKQDLLKLAERHRVQVYSKEDLKSVGGMDPLLTHPILNFVDLQYRIHQRHDRVLDIERLCRDFGLEELSFTDSLDSQIFVMKHMNDLNRVGFLDNSCSAQDMVPLKTREVEEKLFYRKEWMRDMYLSLYNATPKVALEGNFNLVKRVLGWRIDPKSYELYWKIKYLPGKFRLWFFKFSFPFRKVYYFLNYQYEKRILGLHQSPKGLRS